MFVCINMIHIDKMVKVLYNPIFILIHIDTHKHIYLDLHDDDIMLEYS